ncbi:hypothetical protein ABPG72_004998 [Tetrahymena utriculariae]
MNNTISLEAKNSTQSVNKVGSPIGALHFFGSGDLNSTNHLRVIQFEYQALQEGIQHLENMIQYSVENHENQVRDKFLVKKNRLSRKKREIYEQEQQLQRQEMELNQNPQIKKALLDLSQLKEFHERKEKQYQKIQEVINKEDETLKALKRAHEIRIEKLKNLISINIEAQMKIDKMKKYLKLKRKQKNMQTASQPNLNVHTNKDNSIVGASQQNNTLVQPNSEIIITEAAVFQKNKEFLQNKTTKLLINLEQTYQTQLPTINSSTTQNVSKSVTRSNVLQNVGKIQTSRNSQNRSNKNNRYQACNSNNSLSNSLSVPSILLKKQKKQDSTFSQNSSILNQQQQQQQQSLINPNASSILAMNEFDDMASIDQAQQSLIANELEQIKKEIQQQKKEIESKKKQIFKNCNSQLELNNLVKECFNLVSKKLTSTLSMSDKKGFKESMYLTLRNNSLFVTQNEQIVSDFKELQHNNNINIQDRLLGSIVFDSMMNIIRKQEQEKLNKQQYFPYIPYRNFSQFTLGQLLTIINLKPDLKDQLFLSFQFKKQIIHLLLEDLNRKIGSNID